MDRVELTNLFDIYESLLTDREKEIFKYYYYEDLSLSEIGENLNITRTGVFNTLKKVEEKLTQFEASLKLMNIKNTLKGLLDEADIGVIKNTIKKIIWLWIKIKRI